ncbi:hypothetical protein B0A50_01698 [Salinomyces thailandicus]|uniref:C2H2-type domain-containing protein n=1 Tax=Salinomyces thailandicus TaxID=706561 RepID=A0A4U0U8J9_9PEZI|nr:hypothetical protein B0A50_01698 [Salinomyces thailandica]
MAAFNDYHPGMMPFTSNSHAPASKAQRRARAQSIADTDIDRSVTSNDTISLATKKRKVLYPCEPCGTSYTEKRALARHRHTAQHRRNLGLPPSEKYACTLCPKSFSREHDRVRHVNETHNGMKRSGRSNDTPESEGLSVGLTSARTPSSWQSDGLRLDLGCGDDYGFVVDSDANSVTNGWDTLGSTVEVYPGPAMYGSKGHAELPLQCQTIPEGSPVSSGTNTTPPSSTGESSRPNDSWCDGRSHQTRYMDTSDDEDDMIIDTAWEYHRKPPSLVAEDSAVDMSDDIYRRHDPKLPSIAVFDRRHERKTPVTDDHVESELARFRDLNLKSLPRATLVQGRNKTTTIPAREPSLCIFCNDAFESDHRALLTHLRRHLEELRGDQSCICEECQVGFANKADLAKHKVSADVKGHCGFAFEHKYPCTGHHRPAGLLCPDFVDSDRFQLGVQLRHWEQSQLKAYMVNIETLVTEQNKRASAVYSIEQLCDGSSMRSFSCASSINTYNSAPCDGPEGHMDVGGLQKRLRLRSLKSSAKRLPQMLRSGGLSLNKSGGDHHQMNGGRGILPAASEWSDPDALRLLLGLGANINTHDGHYGSALASAARQGRLESVQLLLSEGADVQQLGGKYGSALGAAAAGGHRHIVELLLKHGSNINAGEGTNGPPLSVAAANGQLKMLQYLLERGADIDRSGGDEGCPIGFAVWYGRTSTASLLAQQGAALNVPGGKHGTPLCAAVEATARGRADIEMINVLIDRGADVNFGSPLCTAAAHADLKSMTAAISLLLSRGAHPNMNDSTGGSALQYAKKRRERWVNKLFFSKEDVNENVEEIIGYCDAVIELLREHGARDGGRIY